MVYEEGRGFIYVLQERYLVEHVDAQELLSLLQGKMPLDLRKQGLHRLTPGTLLGIDLNDTILSLL
jgi:hypothetical protein